MYVFRLYIVCQDHVLSQHCGLETIIRKTGGWWMVRAVKWTKTWQQQQYETMKKDIWGKMHLKATAHTMVAHAHQKQHFSEHLPSSVIAENFCRQNTTEYRAEECVSVMFFFKLVPNFNIHFSSTVILQVLDMILRSIWTTEENDHKSKRVQWGDLGQTIKNKKMYCVIHLKTVQCFWMIVYYAAREWLKCACW